MNDALILPKPLAELLDLLQPEIANEVRSGLSILRIKAAQLAVELISAAAEEIPMSVAVHRPADYPLTVKIHHGMEAFLLYELDDEQAALVRAFYRRLSDAPGLIGEVRKAIFDVAREDVGPWASVARFFAYEAARLNLLLATWEVPEVEASSLLREFDLEAEHVLCEQLVALPRDVRPLEMLVGELMVRLNAAVEERAAELASVVDEVRAEIARRTVAVSVARTLSPEKNVVLRNALAPDEERMASSQLLEIFPELFSSAEQVDQVRHRLKDAKPTKRTRVIDLIREEV